MKGKPVRKRRITENSPLGLNIQKYDENGILQK
jgi:hypothetical protein